MNRYIALFISFSAYLCISNADDDIFKSLERLNLNPEQKKHISTLKSQVLYRVKETDVVKPRVQQNVIDMLNVTSSSDIATFDKLFQNVKFLEICPQLVQTIDDLSYSLPTKIEAYKIITGELEKLAENRTETLGQITFSLPETWKIFTHWIIYRISNSEKYTLSTFDEFVNKQDLFVKLQDAFSGPARKEFLKSIVLDLGLHISLIKSPPLLEDLKKRFAGLESTIADIIKFKIQTHFVHVFLPYGLKNEDEFLGLANWLMFRIDSKDEEVLKSEFPKLFEFRTKFRDELKQVEDIGESIEIVWQIAKAYMNKT